MLEETACKKSTLETEEMKSAERRHCLKIGRRQTRSNTPTAMQVAFPRLDLASSRGAVVSAIYNIATVEYLYYETARVSELP